MKKILVDPIVNNDVIHINDLENHEQIIAHLKDSPIIGVVVKNSQNSFSLCWSDGLNSNPHKSLKELLNVFNPNTVTFYQLNF